MYATPFTAALIEEKLKWTPQLTLQEGLTKAFVWIDGQVRDQKN